VRALQAVLPVVIAAVTMIAVAVGAPGGARQRVVIDMSFHPNQTFLFRPQDGTLKGDSGRIAKIPESEGREVVRNGQDVTTYIRIWTLRGKRGVLTIREHSDWVRIGADVNGDGWQGDSVAHGTWKVVRGTGQYTGVRGGGGSGHAGLGNVWHGRLEGVLTPP
jgi:hypothetical protein